MVASDGGIFNYGSAPFDGSHGGSRLNQPIVGMASTPDGNGYWLVASDGGIFGYGDAGFFGSHGGSRLNQPIVGMASTPDGNGYWLVASDGGIFGYGDAGFFGSHGGSPLNQPIVGMASTPDGNGYWLVASDGGIFGYGDAGFFGSHGGSPLNQPIVGMATTPDGMGYWLVASDGGIFNYGDAGFFGSHGGSPLNRPVVGMASTLSGNGYWLVASDGGIFGYGDGASSFYGSLGGSPLNQPIVGMAALPRGHGYWASDDCYYYLQGAQWYGSLCVRYGTYADGSTDTNLWNFYAFAGAGQIPSPIQYQVDWSNPSALTFRDETDPSLFDLVGWVQVPYDGSAPLYYLCSDPPLDGTCAWFTLAEIEAAAGVSGTNQLPPSQAVEDTVTGADLAIENLAQSIANSDAPDYCESDINCVAIGINGFPVDADARPVPALGPGFASNGRAASPATSAPEG